MRTHRKHSGDYEYGWTCIDCGGPKAQQYSRCRACWRDNVLRNDDYWESRRCPDCGGAKSRQAMRCRPCANKLYTGKPRSAPVAVPANHKWRRMRFGKAA